MLHDPTVIQNIYWNNHFLVCLISKSLLLIRVHKTLIKNQWTISTGNTLVIFFREITTEGDPLWRLAVSGRADMNFLRKLLMLSELPGWNRLAWWLSSFLYLYNNISWRWPEVVRRNVETWTTTAGKSGQISYWCGMNTCIQYNLPVLCLFTSQRPSGPLSPGSAGGLPGSARRFRPAMTPVPLSLYSLSSSCMKWFSKSPGDIVRPQTGQLDGSRFFLFTESQNATPLERNIKEKSTKANITLLRGVFTSYASQSPSDDSFLYSF